MRTDLTEIAIRAAVTAVEAFLAGILAAGLTDLTIETAELAALTGLGAGLSVIYNAARAWLDAAGPRPSRRDRQRSRSSSVPPGAADRARSATRRLTRQAPSEDGAPGP